MHKCLTSLIIGSSILSSCSNSPKQSHTTPSQQQELVQVLVEEKKDMWLKEPIVIDSISPISIPHRDFISHTIDSLYTLFLEDLEESSWETPYTSLIDNTKEPIILGNLSRNQISLTFDDGYHKQSIKDILSLLQDHEIKATFFIIGECIKKYPELRKQAILDGHQICNHSDTHTKYFKKWDTEFLEKEILDWEHTVKTYLGDKYLKLMKQEFPFFRFPGGSWAPDLLEITKKYGYLPFNRYYENNSSLDPINWWIILYHFNKWEVEKVFQFIEEIHTTCVPLSELLRPTDTPIGWKNIGEEVKKQKQSVSDLIMEKDSLITDNSSN